MKEKILESLKTKYSGVQASILDRVATVLSKTVKEESEIETATAGVSEMVNEFSGFFQSETDRRVQDAIKKHEETLKTKFDFVEKGKKKTDETDIDKLVREAIEKAVQPFQSKIDQFEKKTTTDALFGNLKQKLVSPKDKGGFGIPEDDLGIFGLMSNVKLEKPEDVDAVATTISGDYDKKIQALTLRGFQSETPRGGNAGTNTVISSLEAWAKKGNEKKREK